MRHPSHADGGRRTEWKSVRLLVFGTDDQFRFLVRQTFRKLAVGDIVSYGVAADTTDLIRRGADLAIVDLTGVPDEGLTVIERLRGHSPGAIPILVVASSALKGAVDHARALGIEGMVPKPVSGHELTLRVAETLAAPTRMPAPTAAHDRVRPNFVRAVPSPPPPAPPPVPIPPPAPIVAVVSAPPPQAPTPPRRIEATGGRIAAALTRRPSGGTLGDDDLVALPTRPSGRLGDEDLAPSPFDAEAEAARRRAERRRQAWQDALAAEGRVVRIGGDIARFDLSAVIAEHAKWLESSGAEGQRANFASRDLAGADLTDTILPQASFRETDLSDASLARARLDGSDFRRAVLSAADLGGANLGVAALRHARLDLSNLEGAILRGSDLSGAVLSRARLAGADLKGAILIGADLRAADLSKVENLTQTQVEKTLCNLDTRLPPGLSRPPGGEAAE
jgi:uncharacterized protein YjbI with pentapeptide repeats/DNA-binding NarL/FixJ family response regulator